MRKTSYTVSIDKLRVCLNVSTDIYNYLKDHYTLYNNEGNRALDEDNFTLTFIEDDEHTMRATLDMRDVGCYYRLGIFTFSNRAKRQLSLVGINPTHTVTQSS